MSDTVFDTLVQGMSRGERQEMLEKIHSAPGLEPDPIVAGYDDAGEVNLQNEYHKMSLLQKLWIFVQKIFTGKDHLKLVERSLLMRLGNRINAVNPGLVDQRGEGLQEGFAYRIDDLRTYVQRLAGPLSSVLGDTRKQFVTFMFSMVAPTTYDLMQQETDPETVAQAHPELNDRELKKRLTRTVMDILESVQTDQRNQVYMNYRFLYHLLQLASFPYAQILKEFQGAGGQFVATRFKLIEGVLRRLDSQIRSTTEIPSSDVLQMVFVFMEKEQKDADEQSERITQQLKRANESVAVLRSFAREVPLRDIIAFCSADIRYAPLELSGGEDWFTLFRDHISDVIDRRVDSYILQRRRKEIVSRLLKLGGSTAFPDGAPYATKPLYANAQYPLSATIVQYAAERMFAGRWLSPLKILMINGEFYKDVNREEYNTAFEKIEGIEERVSEFLKSLPEAPKTPGSDMQGFLRNADTQVRKVIDDMIHSLDMLLNIIDGILFGEVGGRFDTIANLGQINGRSNHKYLKQLEAVLREIEQVRDLLRESVELEQTRRRGN